MHRASSVIWIGSLIWVISVSGCSTEDALGPGTADLLHDSAPGVDILSEGVSPAKDDLSTDEGKPSDLGSDIEVSEACEAGSGCLGDPCTGNEDCESGICISHMGSLVCSEPCLEECPQGWKCKQIELSGTDLIFACVSDFMHLCQPCRNNEDCRTGEIQNVCVDYGEEGAFCGSPCADHDECPGLYL